MKFVYCTRGSFPKITKNICLVWNSERLNCWWCIFNKDLTGDSFVNLFKNTIEKLNVPALGDSIEDELHQDEHHVHLQLDGAAPNLNVILFRKITVNT